MTYSVDTVRVYIVEDQLLFGHAVAHVISADRSISVTGIARNSERAQLKDGDADVIVLDVDADLEGLEAAVEDWRERYPTVKICTLSMYSNPELMQRCLSAGVDGYVLKDTSLQELVAAIKTIAEGSSYVDPRVAAALLRAPSRTHLPYSSELSPRETDIIRLIACGLSNRDIGLRLALSEKTVKNHVSRIFSKLHLTARSQAAVHAIRNGLA